MITLTHHQWGEDFTLTPAFGHYGNGRIAIVLEDEVEPFAKITVNLVDAPDLNEGEVYVKAAAENSLIVERMIEEGWLIDTGRSEGSGYNRYSVMELSGALLEAYEERQ